MRGASRRAAVIAAAGCCGVGCFVDGGPPTATGTSTGAATSGAVTGGGATSGATSATTSSTSATTTGGGGSTGAPEPATGVSGSASSTAGEATTEAPVCPALDPFMSPQVVDAACETCLRQQCCAEFEACAGDCVGVWNCAHGQDCLTAWADCPGFDAQESAFDAATGCMNTVCHAVCNLGPCAAEVTACDADPECGAIGTCAAACLQDCPDCVLECWGVCKQEHPEGAAEFDAFWACSADHCP